MVTLPFPKPGPFFPFHLLLIFHFLGFSAQAGELEFPTDTLRIETSSGTRPLKVELALTPAQKAQGLMFRRVLPLDQGMLFDFGSERNIQMWMKNTYIPLDMIFISSDGKILAIRENTIPKSEKIISIGRLAKGVLEVNAGVSRQLNLKVGDKIHHSMFE